MDEYDKKFAEMQKYIPFLEAMIERLQNVKDKDNREIQLQKMQGLHGILSNSKRKLKMETLQRCEDVLQKLHNRVEKGNTPDLQLPIKRNDGVTPQPSTSSEDAKSEQNKKTEQPLQDAEKAKEIGETPASPDTGRSSSPDCQILPIIIPVERNVDGIGYRRRQKIIPVITLTERTKDITISSPTDSTSDDVTFTEWDMLEESERHNAKNRGDWQSTLVASGHDVATAAKLVSSNLPQKASDNRNYTLGLRNVPTVPVPALGGSRRLTSVLEKNKLNLDMMAANVSRPESPVNVPEVRLKSPDPEILFAKPRVTSPRPKDNHNVSKMPLKPPSIPLLLSPPPFSNEPPLSMEDLEELLNDENDGEKKSDKAGENAAKHKKDSDKQETIKDGKISKSFLLSDRENEKRREEMDRHTLKLTPRKCSSNVAGISTMKSNEIKGPPYQSNDHRLAQQIPFLGTKFQEPRYADNYERHPRQRDAHGHESTKEKLIAGSNIPEDASSQIPIIHNTANSLDDRNNPLYQRRSTVSQEGRKDAGPPRPESEFVIEGIDYYNMHMNQLHWPPSTATSDHQFSDHQFSNAQWTAPAYGMANPSLQSTQHPYQHTIESQFRPNQFSSNLPAGPRSLLSPTGRSQDINHIVRPENIREDISTLRSPPVFPVAPQYRGFQMNQGSYDSTFSVDRPVEYSHVRPTWEGPANRAGETPYENVIPCGIQVTENPTGTSYPRPNTPCPWGTRDRDRGNRGRGRDGYYERNRVETRPNFNRDVRRTDWPRDGHSDRENPNRFPNRDPRVRTEHNVASPNQTKETGASARDPRLAKDKHVNASIKAKDATHNERDPRKRNITTKMMKEKAKSQKSLEKEKTDKLPKDRMQSPLESLYGVIDTKASQSSGLQKFKIPKIKRPGPPQPKRVSNETKNTESVLPGLSRAKSNSKKSNNNSRSETSKDDASTEVSSSSDGNYTTEDLIQSKQDDVAKEGEVISLLEETDKNEVKIGEADSVMDDKSNDVVEKSKKDELETDGSKPKEEVTQEWIEALIRKSFESGEGKKLVEQAKLIQKLGEALKAKKLKKIKKIIECESESSSSDKDEAVETKKTQTKKKRRVIVSDSSDDECLAERLGILNTSANASDEGTEMVSTIPTDPKNLEENVDAIASDNLSEQLVKDVIAKKSEGLLGGYGEKRNVQIDNNSKNKDARSKKKRDKEDNRLEDNNENTGTHPENNKQIGRLEGSVKEKKQTEDRYNKLDQISIEKPKDISSIEQLLDQDKNQADYVEPVASNTANDKADEMSGDKPKAKTKRRNSLEMLQEDIREMFISEGVVAATGYRMCRLSKEYQPTTGMNPSTSLTSSKKDEVSNTATEKKAAEPATEVDESVASNIKSRKNLRSRNIGESTKQKVKNRKDAKRATRNVRSKESVPSSGSEEDQPLALRTEKLLNNTDNSTPNQEGDCDEESDALRRSKRFLRKDTVKEPRVVVEKTDITKIDSSKVMFDSSSDESFGIDVSELTAVVDVSLRPDKQSDQDSMDTNSVASSRRRKTVKNVGKRNTKSKKVSALLTDDKSEDGMSVTDEESIVSDISMSSNATVKRTSGGSARTSAKEELLSNILVGLVSTPEKNTLLTDKGLEEDTNEHPPTTEINAKKSSTKKKKKKFSWQMGIVSTKKRKKKTASVASFKTAQTSVEMTSTETNVSMETVENDRSISEDNNRMTLVAEKIEDDKNMMTLVVEKIEEDKNRMTLVAAKIEEFFTDNHTSAPVDDANIDSIVKCDEIIKPFVNTDLSNLTALSEPSNAIKETFSNESLISIEENKPTVKMEMMETQSAESAVATAPSVAVNTFFKNSSKIVYDEQMTELFCKMDAKRLIEYAWTGQDKYKCLLCIFAGKNIVHHYKVNHPKKEVLIARLKFADAEIAIADTESSATTVSAETSSQVCKFHCRFCYFVTEGAADVALEAFYEHCTTHTGEYRFHCNSCSYQAVAKASMRTHYYKMCRKHNDTFNESASEDDVPKEGGVYGYLCRSCNYVQLKRHNVEAHVAFWHRDKLTTEIVKINMSTTIVENIASSNETSEQSTSANAESFVMETKPKVLELENIERKDVLEMETAIMESQDNININEECIIHEPKTEENIQIKEEEADGKLRASQGELEGSTSSGNLSAFVCPPELENKEDEIQRERQKMMQEIANNIGILLKNSKPGLSIIDKLQDKMRTDTVISPIPECNTSTNVPEVKKNFSPPLTGLTAQTLELENNVIIKEDFLSQSSNLEDSSVSTQEQSVADNSKEMNDVDKTDTKIRDPLAIMDPCKKANESDGETSDNERSAPVFESDSSSEQSDSEPTDVNMILKETSSMNASSSRGPMLTTIQRLAAQLQNAKPLEPVPKPVPDIKVAIKSEPVSLIPKPPDVVPIASVKELLAKQLNVKHWEMETLAPAPHNANDNANPPKNFIRLRRLSGDMLSVPVPDSEDTQTSSTDETRPNSAKNVLQTDAEEECSFLKIENVVSLARSENNETESPILNDIRKAVQISPTKGILIPILKKPNQPLILKKVKMHQLRNTNVQNIQPATSEHVTLFPIKSLPTTVSAKTAGGLTTNFVPIMPKTLPVTVSSVNMSTSNYKIKVIRTPALTKPKDMSPVAIKLKSMEAYAAMLSETKLIHFFKCMSRDCCYTTDSLTLYSQHYLQHEEANKQSNALSHDHQKCAYCYMSLNDWVSMKNHLWDKHSHCRYQCGYCFYRSIVPSYLHQHQTICHPGSKFYYLLGKTLKRIQRREDINRRDSIIPFMCKHDCDKYFYIIERFIMHLKTKHSSSQLLYTCHMCNIKYATMELFISHYKIHGLAKFQCLYCLHGTDTLTEMHQHLSTYHCNRLPQTIERSLPLTPIHNTDVINQLILRTHFNETTKMNKGITDLNIDGSKKGIPAKDGVNDQISTAPLNIEVALNQEHSNSTKTSVIHFAGVSDNLSNAESSNVSNISTKKSTDVVLQSTEVVQKQSLQNKPFLQSEKEKLTDYATKQIFQEPELELLSCMNDSSAIDPLEFSGEFNCSDEFVNTNLLDNPEFLKSLTVTSSNTSLSTGDTATSTDKMEDSDIEILENIENEKKNVKNDIKQIIDPKSSEPKAEVKEQSALCNTTEDKCTSEKTPANPTDMTAEKPLTLDDIKDTGRAGLELYKCGYLECSFAAQNVILLKSHIKKCTFGEPIRNLFCPHCKKRFIKIGFLLEHLKAHGLKRFGCSLCKMRYAVAYQATAHMKTKHKLPNTKITPADPTNPSVDGLFIIHALPFGSAERKTKKRKGAKSGMEESEKTADNEKLSFSPDEIEQLPRQAIYNREVQCAVCPYTTKVRTNIIRHLQLHAKDETVPESGPVNPVPCLDKKEKMFDKMVNLASSSHQNGRMGGKTRETVQESEEDDSIPKFVPEHKRYVCSVTECNYLTVDEAMLRYHLKALHSEEPYFRCPHCPPSSPGQESQNIAIDKMGVHLKMHDTRLYKCSHCNHHHYHRHVVERHLSDKHPEKRPFVKVIRELESTENVQQPVQEETEDEVPDPDGNHWKCNLCDFKCVYKADIATHADTVHGENNQYKCTLCSFKTSGKVLLEQHVNGKHAYDSNADYILIYQRIKGVNKRNAEVVEQGGQDEPFDTTPLWRRSMPRIRHIRGILLEEEIEAPTMNETVPAASKVSLGKRKNDAEISMKPAKIKSNGKSMSLDENNKQSKEKSKRSLSCEKLFGEAGGEGQITKEGAKSKLDSCSVADIKSAKNSKTNTAELNDSDVGRFGPYGKPEGNMYVCTLCNNFKTKYKHDMRDHIYRELNYARWHCKICGFLSVNRKALLQHFTKRHCGECPESEALAPDNAIEDWVMTLLKKQTDIIKATFQNVNVIYKNVAIPINTPAASSEDSNTISPKKIQAKKAVNLAPTISNLQNDILRDINRSNIDTDDGDSRDNEDLVIDMKEDETIESRNNENMPENDKFLEKTEDVLEKPLVCKHCQMTFIHRRGFKLHVQLSHLKRLGFLCPYCDRSTNSETMMRQHIRSKHPNDPQKIIQNSSAWGNTKLTNEFWEKEYGLVSPLKSKKRKSNTDNTEIKDISDSSITGVDMREKCEVCGFMAINYTGLKSHMRTHAAPKHNFKCMYCTYSCSFKAELLEHWDFNHPALPFKYQELPSAAGPSSSGEARSTPSSPKKRDIDASDNAKEERATSVDKPTTIYSCSYCNLRSNSLSSVRRHWSIMHKESKDITFKGKLPFRYKEISLPKLSSKHCVSKNVAESPRDLAKQSEDLSSMIQEYGWVCQWCQEFCKTDSDRITHQNMFHSHLPQNFKWQEEQQQQQEEQDQLKSSSIRLSAYNVEKYAGLATSSKSIPNFESIVENLIASQVRLSDFVDVTAKNESSQNRILSSSKGGDGRQSTARKSTTKSIVSYVRPGPRIFKAVARKSTNPRYPPFTPRPSIPHSAKTESHETEEEKMQSKPYSYYGTSSSPINLAELSTYMVVGGHNMRVNCLTLATLININPKILLRDLKKNPKYAAIFD